MQTVTLTPIPIPHTRKMTPAIKKRLEIIQSHVLDTPNCSNSDIQKNSGTSNHGDTQLDIDYSISTGGLIYIKSTKKYFKEPIKDGFQDSFLLQQTLDEIIDIIHDDPRLQKTKIIKQLKNIAKKINKSNVGILTDTYKHGINHGKSEGEQLLYKGMLLFFQETKIFITELQRLGFLYPDMRLKSHKYYETRLELTKEIIPIENSSDETSLNTRDIKIHRSFLDVSHERDWKIFESFAQRIDDSLESLTAFANFLKKLFMFYSIDPKSICSEYMDTDELSSCFDQMYDDGKKYQLMLKAPNIRSLEELVEIQNDIFKGNDKDILARNHGYKNKGTMINSLKKICYKKDVPDFDKIRELQRIHSNRILVSSTSDEKIYSLAQNFKSSKGYQDMTLTFQEDKAKEILQEHKPYFTV